MVEFRIKPSQKENWRYIAFEILSEKTLAEEDVRRAIVQSVVRLLGEIGASKTNVWLLNYSTEQKKGIIRCSHTSQKEVIASITTITKLEDASAVFNVLGVSGSVKKANYKYLKGVLKRKLRDKR